MQNWIKKGLILNQENIKSKPEWMHNYFSVPFIEKLDDQDLKIYFTSRNKKGKSLTGWATFNIDKITEGPLQVSEVPLLKEFGEKGTFDEDGVMGCHITNINNNRYLYYIGWNIGNSVPFRNSIGLAISNSDDLSFKRFSKGPILDRSIYDNCFVASNCILKEKNHFRMYYLSCNEWTAKDNKLIHKYNIKYAESIDGINWERKGIVAIDFKYKNEYAISVPRVLKENGIYKMWYSYRGGNISETYSIGYAESLNGIEWVRKDENLIFLGKKEKWDSEMMCYPFIFDYKKNRYMLYNGNSYGKSGIGLAILKKTI